MHTIWPCYPQFIVQGNSLDLAKSIIGASPGDLVSINSEQVLVADSSARRFTSVISSS